MKNIIRIVRNDIHNIRKNVIALIVIFGASAVCSRAACAFAVIAFIAV